MKHVKNQKPIGQIFIFTLIFMNSSQIFLQSVSIILLDETKISFQRSDQYIQHKNLLKSL